MVRCQISANMSSFLPVVWNHVPPYFSHVHLISFKRLSDLFYFCFISFQLLFNILQNLLSGCHQFFNLWVLAFFVCKKESFVQKCTFGGWIWPATLVGWFCDSYLFAILYSPFFSIIRISSKWQSRMNNLYRKMPIFVQNRFNRFHHFSIGFTQLSNLFQPFAVGSNQFLASYGLFHCFSLDFSSFFNLLLPWVVISCSIYFISSASTFISVFFLVFWEGFQKEFFVQKCTFGGWIWPATLLGWFCESYFLASLCISIFP